MGFVQRGKLMDTVDAVAQAIFIENSGPAVELAEYFEPCPDWDEVPEGTRDYYRRLARAAIDAHTAALGLTEHNGVRFQRNGDPIQALHTHDDPAHYPVDRWEHYSRLVSPWVRKDNTNE